MKEPAEKSILVVDNSPLLRMLIMEAISSFMPAAAFTEAVSGVEAVSKIQDREFDMVIIITNGETDRLNPGELRGIDSHISEEFTTSELRKAVLSLLA